MKNIREGGFLIAKIHHLSGRILAEKLRDHQVEINPAQGRIMYALWQEHNIPIKALAQKTALKKSTLTNMLARLEKMGFIDRQTSSLDHREILISRSDKDRTWQNIYLQISKAMGDVFYKGFSDEEIEHFEDLLQRILRNLENH